MSQMVDGDEGGLAEEPLVLLLILLSLSPSPLLWSSGFMAFSLRRASVEVGAPILAGCLVYRGRARSAMLLGMMEGWGGGRGRRDWGEALVVLPPFFLAFTGSALLDLVLKGPFQSG
ncbi:hypothetical protein BDK51DRAFT_48035 [Blyttiomyces helicus]|uniref:Uncharacterized protein n=1 Tax=Blyttiomyces helicus TaxID=388810 RepID=A0A4P9VZY3_9FUNG|nr:hypothetical protein BDK51DRAFT_48035 [Blyttiomyces helicus]|eukprot:RKO85411.1 hypothetical protein BDK51DRAFT_48035 [Blyttiomyces helicus]